MTDKPNPEDANDDWNPREFKRDADKGREPELISGQMGRRMLSIQALLERIERQFMDEHDKGGEESPALRDADTATKRLKLVLSVVDYVLAVESVVMSNTEKADLIAKSYSNIFGYGPLDALFLDETVTTISLDGPNKVSVRRGHGDLTSTAPIFQDEIHLARILRRLLNDAGTDIFAYQPFVETGLIVEGRPVSVNLIAPPLTVSYTADIRVHPKNAPTLNDLVTSGFMSAEAAELLKSIAESAHGFVIVGDTESGKTTLLGALTQFIAQPEKVVAVERAGEMHLPEGVKRLLPRWPSKDDPTMTTFGQQIGVALEQNPACIILDEVRADEPQSIAPLLSQPEAPRQLWSFRGPFDSKRLRNALSMLARRADMSQGEVLVQAMYQRLPFVFTVWRARGQIRLYSIGEWQNHSSDVYAYPDYVLLMDTQEGELRATGEKPSRVL